MEGALEGADSGTLRSRSSGLRVRTARTGPLASSSKRLRSNTIVESHTQYQSSMVNKP